MELNILYAIQNLHCEWLDNVMVVVFNTIVGDKGQIWVWLGIAALIFPKTRKVGIGMLLSYLLAYFIGDGLLKDLIARPRPCMVDETVELLVKRPSSFSCPSVHSALAFACVTAIFINYKKVGIIFLVFAALIAFSRMYFFVHYPTDVLFGAVLGVVVAIVVSLAVDKGSVVLKKKKASK